MTPTELCTAHHRIALDANVLIYLLDGDPVYGPLARDVIRAAEQGGNRLVVSSWAIAEAAAGPAFAGDEAMADRYGDAILSMPFVEIVPLGPTLAVDAAAYAARLHIRLPDAVHLATARGGGASVFLTNDRRLPSLPRLRVVLFSDLAPAADRLPGQR